MNKRKVRETPAWGCLAPLAVFLLVIAALTCSVQDASGQENFRQVVIDHTEITPFVSLALWPESKREYMHVYEAGGRGQVEVDPLRLVGYARGVFWQTSASQVPGSPVNAENNMTWMVKYGGSVRYYYNGWFLGPAIHRTEIHVVWRFKNQNGYRDGFGSYDGTPGWEQREAFCRAGKGCPSIGYQDGAGGVVGYDGKHVTAWVKYLRHWKGHMTLRPRPLRTMLLLRLPDSWELGDWEVEARTQRDAKGKWRGDVRLRYRVFGSLFAVVRGGRVQPDHKTPFYRVAAGVLIR